MLTKAIDNEFIDPTFNRTIEELKFEGFREREGSEKLLIEP